MDEILIKTENLTHIYSIGTPFEHVAIDHIDLEIRRGDYVGVIGHTGSGKSTLLQHFNALVKPTGGTIYFKGQDIWKKGYNLRSMRFQVGLVFQYPEYQLFEETVEKDIAFAPKNMGLSEREIKERVYEAIRIVGLKENILSKSPFDLSGGQKRRVAIAGIMAMRPSVLILDEPTAGLDPVGRDEILMRIRDYHAMEGNTVILVSHSMEDIAENAKHVLVMHQGKVVMFEPTENVFKRADELVSMGLDVPQLTRVFMNLRNKGYPVDSCVFTPEQAVTEIMHVRNELR